MVVMIRAGGDASRWRPPYAGCVAAIDRNLPIESLRPFEQTVAASLAQRRFSTLLLALFAGLAMVLAAVGIYGLLNYWVRVREDEIAIRMALGAPRPAILRWAGGQALRLSLTGAAIGMLAGWAASRWHRAAWCSGSRRGFATLVGRGPGGDRDRHARGGHPGLARDAGGCGGETASRVKRDFSPPSAGLKSPAGS